MSDFPEPSNTFHLYMGDSFGSSSVSIGLAVIFIAPSDFPSLYTPSNPTSLFFLFDQSVWLPLDFRIFTVLVFLMLFILSSDYSLVVVYRVSWSSYFSLSYIHLSSADLYISTILLGC